MLTVVPMNGSVYTIFNNTCYFFGLDQKMATAGPANHSEVVLSFSIQFKHPEHPNLEQHQLSGLNYV